MFVKFIIFFNTFLRKSNHASYGYDLYDLNFKLSICGNSSIYFLNFLKCGCVTQFLN